MTQAMAVCVGLLLFSVTWAAPVSICQFLYVSHVLFVSLVFKQCVLKSEAWSMQFRSLPAENVNYRMAPCCFSRNL